MKTYYSEGLYTEVLRRSGNDDNDAFPRFTIDRSAAYSVPNEIRSG